MAAPSNDSRYYPSTIDYLAPTASGDNYPVIFYDFSEIGEINYVNYTWKYGDRVESLAAKFSCFQLVGGLSQSSTLALQTGLTCQLGR